MLCECQMPAVFEGVLFISVLSTKYIIYKCVGVCTRGFGWACAPFCLCVPLRVGVCVIDPSFGGVVWLFSVKYHVSVSFILLFFSVDAYLCVGRYLFCLCVQFPYHRWQELLLR